MLFLHMLLSGRQEISTEGHQNRSKNPCLPCALSGRPLHLLRSQQSKENNKGSLPSWSPAVNFFALRQTVQVRQESDKQAYLLNQFLSLGHQNSKCHRLLEHLRTVLLSVFKIKSHSAAHLLLLLNYFIFFITFQCNSLMYIFLKCNIFRARLSILF